ncbi:MAG: hypothetical protein M0Z36_08445 [Thermaerobacter sp.]|nr:hypothetical protein [Gammaproteobacteria bacterium]MDA8206084.1 hypothetical protein [Thermaerobacter sp.]
MILPELLDMDCQIPGATAVVIMPLSRLVLHEAFCVGRFHFFPAGSLDFARLRPIPNDTIDRYLSCDAALLEGPRKREIETSLTGFDINSFLGCPVVAFCHTLDWDAFYGANHNADISLLMLLTSLVERALDLIRFYYCRLDLPDTLPGPVGSWNNSGEHIGALLYSPLEHESYLIAGAAIESAVIARGLGLELDTIPPQDIPSSEDGDVARILLQGLSLYSDALYSYNSTTKFIRVMTLLEYLASPWKYQKWQKAKSNIACHCANEKTHYHELCERFRFLTSGGKNAEENGLRTRIVHMGKFLPEIIEQSGERKKLFKELQWYCSKVLGDMIENKHYSQEQYERYRDTRKCQLGVKDCNPT